MVHTHPYCICAVVAERGLKSLLENSGQGRYRVEDPWIVADRLFESARSEGQHLPIIFATGHPLFFSHWGFIDQLTVVQLHRGSYETECMFARLDPVNPIWNAIDSLFLKPAREQLDREVLEGIRQHRHPLTEGELHPYAICETPGFILERDV